MSQTYLTTFFQEKNLSYQIFEITDSNGLTHFIDTDVVKEAIFNASPKEQLIISQTLRKLDFYAQPVNDYLKFLGEALVKRFGQTA